MKVVNEESENRKSHPVIGCGCLGSLALFIVVGVIIEAMGDEVSDSPPAPLMVAAFIGMVFFGLLAALTGRPSAAPRELRAMPYTDYLRTPHWRRRRAAKIRAAGGRCQLCGRGGSGTLLDVHHNTYERLGEERDEDLIVLCRECHSRHHNRYQ